MKVNCRLCQCVCRIGYRKFQKGYQVDPHTQMILNLVAGKDPSVQQFQLSDGLLRKGHTAFGLATTQGFRRKYCKPSTQEQLGTILGYRSLTCESEGYSLGQG